MRPIDADALFEVIKKSMAENPHKEEMQRAMHIHEHKYFLTLLAGIPTIQPEKAQLSPQGATSDLISKTETAEHLRRVLEATVPNTDYDEGFIDGVEFGISTVSTMPTVQPEPAIPLSWIENEIKWLKSLDNTFSEITALQISVMVNKWRDEKK